MERKRRLAVIDTKFPWMLSGFRYWENFYIAKERPDTVFFAVEPHTDPFPSKVYSIEKLEDIIKSHGITDIYCVFLNLTLSLLGENVSPKGSVAGSNSSWSIKEIINKYNLELHTTLYPGGGLDPNTPKEFIEVTGEKCKTIFTNINEVSNVLSESVYIPGIINTQFYKLEKKPEKLPLQIVFCANRAIRKDFPTLAQAFNMLDENFHLHIVGNWGEELNTLKNDNYTFHGTLNPLQLRQLYKNCNIFVSCSTQDTFAWDGFPTTAAAEAIATGCILVSTNSRNDERILEAGEDYFEIDEANPDMLVQTLNMIRHEFPLIQEKGYKTAIKMKTLLDAQENVRKKLNIIL